MNTLAAITCMAVMAGLGRGLMGPEKGGRRHKNHHIGLENDAAPSSKQQGRGRCRAEQARRAAAATTVALTVAGAPAAIQPRGGNYFVHWHLWMSRVARELPLVTLHLNR